MSDVSSLKVACLSDNTYLFFACITVLSKNIPMSLTNEALFTTYIVPSKERQHILILKHKSFRKKTKHIYLGSDGPIF